MRLALKTSAMDFETWVRQKMKRYRVPKTSTQGTGTHPTTTPPSRCSSNPPPYVDDNDPQGIHAVVQPALTPNEETRALTTFAIRPLGLTPDEQTSALTAVWFAMVRLEKCMALDGYHGPTFTAIRAAVREGCIAAVVAVANALQPKTLSELDHDVDEGCRKVAGVVIATTTTVTAAAAAAAATAVIRQWLMMITANSVANVVSACAAEFLRIRKRSQRAYAVATQLQYTAWGVAATICVRAVNNRDLGISDVPLPPRSRFQA